MLTQLARALETADAAAVRETLAEDVTLRVAVHDEPFHGRPPPTSSQPCWTGRCTTSP